MRTHIKKWWETDEKKDWERVSERRKIWQDNPGESFPQAHFIQDFCWRQNALDSVQVQLYWQRLSITTEAELLLLLQWLSGYNTIVNLGQPFLFFKSGRKLTENCKSEGQSPPSEQNMS